MELRPSVQSPSSQKVSVRILVGCVMTCCFMAGAATSVVVGAGNSCAASTVVVREVPVPTPHVVAEKSPEVSSPCAEPDIEGAIKQLDETTWQIDRTLLGQIPGNPSSMARGARIVPAIKNGTSVGFKIYAIRPLSVVAKLGLKNGDTVHSISEHELSSLDRALEVYSAVRDADEVSVTLTRRGVARRHRYLIR